VKAVADVSARKWPLAAWGGLSALLVGGGCLYLVGTALFSGN
jgi:hypothetical protein